MDEEEQNHYVSQLREVFDSCDTTGTGYLDKEELSELCHKLHLEPHLPVILSTLLGPGHYARVNFEEFKEGFVAVLSHSLELSTSEEESSYLEPVLAEEVKPKYVKGTKRYGRRSRPEARGSEVEIAEDPETPGPRAARAEPFSWGARAEQLRRSASLESVESLKSDEETASNKEAYNETFESQGQSRRWKPDAVSSLRQTPGPRDVTDGQMKTIWDELGVGGSGYLSRQELSLVCDSMGLSGLQSEELDALFARLDKDRDGRVSLKEFQEGLFRHAPLSAPTTSTPIKPQQRGSLSQALEDSASRSARPSVLSTTVGPRLLSCLDDGSGGASPEQVIGIWSSEGIRNGKDILQILEFPLDEKLSLAELTLALDNELLSSANGIHQAALISYKSEIQFLHVQAEQACKERDKLKADLERAEKRNLQLVREVDDRHAAMESLNESKIKDLEQDYRDKLSAIRSDLERENELLWQQANQQKAKLEEDLATLRAEDTSLRADVTAAAEENSHLEKEVNELRKKLSESEKTISKLQKDLDNLLMSKFGALDPQGCGLLGQEERFAEIIKEYELQCRKVKELRDRNDELHTELEILRGQVTDRRSRHRQDTGSSHPRAAGRAALTDSGPISPEKDPENMSIETELAVQQLKEKHQQEVQDLKIQLETKVNFYERSIELMKRNMEVERKDIEQGFKMEISELEEQKRQLEEKSERLQEAMAGLRAPLPSWGPEHDKRLLRERAELEQSYAKEISHLVQSLTAEKEQLEEELTQKLERELQQMREEAAEEIEQRLSERESQHAESLRTLVHQLCHEKSQRQSLKEHYDRERIRWESGEQQPLLESGNDKRITEIQQLTVELQEEELEVEAKGEGGLLHMHVEQMDDWNFLQAGPESQLKGKKMFQENYSDQSSVCHQQETQLKSQEDELLLLQRKLQNAQDLLKNTEEELLPTDKLTFVEEDKGGLVEKLENQSVVDEQLNAQYKDQDKDLEDLKKSKQNLQNHLEQEDKGIIEVVTGVDSEMEENRCLLPVYIKLASLSNQLVRDGELSLPTGETKDLLFQLQQKDSLINELQVLLDSEIRAKDHLMSKIRKMEDLLKIGDKLPRDPADRNQPLCAGLVPRGDELSELRRQREDLVIKLQQTELEAQEQLRQAKQDFEMEKNKLKEQLFHMEKLVTDLEAVMGEDGTHRAELDRLTSENSTLKDRLSALQQDSQKLEVDVNRKRKQLEQMTSEKETIQAKSELISQENTRCREEMMDLSNRNLQLSSENAELTSQIRAEQSAIQLLSERLAEASRQTGEEAAVAGQLREAVARLEGEQAGWQRQRELMEQELRAAREKLSRLRDLESELSSLALKHQWLEQDRQRLLEEAEERNRKMEKLQASLQALDSQTEQLHSELRAAGRDKTRLAQDAAASQEMLQEAKDKVQELEASVQRLCHEKEQLEISHRQREQQEVLSLRREHQALRSQHEELLQKVELLQAREAELTQVTQECQALKSKQAELEAELQESQDQLLQAGAALVLARSQHAREAQQLRERAGAALSREQEAELRARLAEEHRRGQQLQEQLRAQVEQASTQMGLQQEHYETVLKRTEERMKEVELKLKTLRELLQEKVEQLKEQLAKNAKSDVLLKDLYVENSQLMKALQVTEQRQKTVEKTNFVLEEKIAALNRLLRKIAPATLMA
nr:PREDICTED: ninein-like protein isoform X3 [Lepisosteus oculatus]XP_015218247.1 PREDICTED: ninein-like protein isoform X3 [Lepisosteus oculatus]XP_015218248.1 PREDICTED: ninein-like protein isoform X3 [Lepisosteus oculatus]XP_015218250.1 PREDICTED: ninein-like protein isoform X3 [Lepisosteus oculatus]XP_015218251.1 PREDICTED: ninein-like protein isoform X3 [Lepisosteus oculatus]XP_015218252.1 PREDICTED: ninein-like protein isoform X3 [Lepisosteus oculatus]XP_015218253.1 PREDICTED: ninein-li